MMMQKQENILILNGRQQFMVVMTEMVVRT